MLAVFGFGCAVGFFFGLATYGALDLFGPSVGRWILNRTEAIPEEERDRWYQEAKRP